MTPERMPRQASEPDALDGPAARRLVYERALSASQAWPAPHGSVAIVLLEVTAAPDAGPIDAPGLAAATSKLASLLHRRVRAVDLLARTADTELAVLLAQASLGVAGAFSERLRQPIEQALRDLGLADDLVVGMGLAASPHAEAWLADALIELADFRLRSAQRRAHRAPKREWALSVDGDAMPRSWADSTTWPAKSDITSDSTL
jgi:ribosomal protein S12 methylthiotransferase accessory factor YcaO